MVASEMMFQLFCVYVQPVFKTADQVVKTENVTVRQTDAMKRALFDMIFETAGEIVITEKNIPSALRTLQLQTIQRLGATTMTDIAELDSTIVGVVQLELDKGAIDNVPEMDDNLE